MSPVSLLPVIPILLLSLLTVGCCWKFLKWPTPKAKYRSIDGLRGYLAFFVFLHHSVIWYFVLRGHGWSFPPSRFYANLGPTSVALFFMITAFLFTTKLLDASPGPLNWQKLYISRIFRIVPLYLAAILLLVLVVGIISGWTLHQPLIQVILEIVQWLFYMEPDINTVSATNLILAGVVWSLAFEWLFYSSLPLLALFFFKIDVPVKTLIIGAIAVLLFINILIEAYPYVVLQRLSPFLGGIAAALLARKEKFRKIAQSPYTSVLIVALLVITITVYPSVFMILPFLCLTMAFIAIACGNTLFGLLSHPLSCLLGQISYSIYLLHGMLLFIGFHFILSGAAATLSPLGHWLVITAASVVLITVCSFTYYFVERPAIAAGALVTGKLKVFRLRFSMHH